MKTPDNARPVVRFAREVFAAFFVLCVVWIPVTLWVKPSDKVGAMLAGFALLMALLWRLRDVQCAGPSRPSSRLRALLVSRYLLRKFKSDDVSLEDALAAHVEEIRLIGNRASGYRLKTVVEDGHSMTILHPKERPPQAPKVPAPAVHVPLSERFALTRLLRQAGSFMTGPVRRLFEA